MKTSKGEGRGLKKKRGKMEACEPVHNWSRKAEAEDISFTESVPQREMTPKQSRALGSMQRFTISHRQNLERGETGQELC